jgi:hypothetical protein
MILPTSDCSFSVRLAFWTWILVLFPAAFALSALAGELGANKVDLMLQYTPFPAPSGNDVEGYRALRRDMARKAIEDARAAGLSFFRVAVTGYGPSRIGDIHNDLALWQSDPAKFWSFQDEMFDDLDRAGIRLVPSFVWNLAQFPALTGDTITTFVTDPESNSRHLLNRFIADFITRYRSRKTILFYELGNEMNLFADLNLKKKCPPGVDKPCVWTSFTTDDMIRFSTREVTAIKALDPSRRVASGYAIQRPAAYHLRHQPEFAPSGPDWTPDTPAEFDEYLREVHAPFDIVTVHIYPSADENRFNRPEGHQYELVADAAASAKAAGKPLFVGEFGDTEATPFMRGLLREIADAHVDYAAIWVWEFYQTATFRTHDTEATRYSVEPGYSDPLIALLRQSETALGQAPSHSAIGRSASAPRIVITWPLPCATIDRPVDVFAVASDGARSVKSVSFEAAGRPLATVTSPPYQVRFAPVGAEGGIIDIKATAETESGAEAVSTISLRLNGEARPCDASRR